MELWPLEQLLLHVLFDLHLHPRLDPCEEPSRVDLWTLQYLSRESVSRSDLEDPTTYHLGDLSQKHLVEHFQLDLLLLVFSEGIPVLDLLDAELHLLVRAEEVDCFHVARVRAEGLEEEVVVPGREECLGGGRGLGR